MAKPQESRPRRRRRAAELVAEVLRRILERRWTPALVPVRRRRA